MSSVPEYRLTPDEYLSLERKAECKSEYVDGVVYATSGGSEPHNVIAGNLIAVINFHLMDRACRVYTSDMKVHRAHSTRYFYPDVTVVCGEPQFLDQEKDVLMNPLVIVEVLSDSTESYDRGTKFRSYTQLESLQEYFLISQDDAVVERYARQGENEWLYTRIEGIEADLHMATIELSVPLKRVYSKAT